MCGLELQFHLRAMIDSQSQVVCAATSNTRLLRTQTANWDLDLTERFMGCSITLETASSCGYSQYHMVEQRLAVHFSTWKSRSLRKIGHNHDDSSSKSDATE